MMRNECDFCLAPLLSSSELRKQEALHHPDSRRKSACDGRIMAHPSLSVGSFIVLCLVPRPSVIRCQDPKHKRTPQRALTTPIQTRRTFTQTSEHTNWTPNVFNHSTAAHQGLETQHERSHVEQSKTKKLDQTRTKVGQRKTKIKTITGLILDQTLTNPELQQGQTQD